MHLHLAPSLSRPLMIYDGECRFCRIWMARWRRLTRGKVAYAPYQRIATQFPEIARTQFAESVHLIQPDGEVYKGAEAVFRSLALRRGWRGLLWGYRRVPGFAWASEAAYQWVARHR